MMVKVFQKNKNGKIELSIEELENALNEAYWDGYNSNKTQTYTYRSPWWSPYYSTSVGSQITLCENEIHKDYDTKITCSNTGDNVR